MSKSSGGFSKIIVWLLAVILIVAVVGVALYFGLREQGMTYYVEYNGQRYMGDTDGGSLVLQTGKPHEFSVKSLTGGDVNYSVKVVSNSINNFRFSVGDELYIFYSDDEERNDYSDVFGLEQTMSGFSVTIPQDMTVESAVAEKYGGDVVLLTEIPDNVSYFMIVVSVGNVSVDVWFTFGAEVAGITIDPPHIVFGGNGAIADDTPDGDLDDTSNGDLDDDSDDDHGGDLLSENIYSYIESVRLAVSSRVGWNGTASFVGKADDCYAVLADDERFHVAVVAARAAHEYLIEALKDGGITSEEYDRALALFYKE